MSQFTVPYAEASFAVPRRQAIHETNVHTMGEILLSIVSQESPIHEDELVYRVCDLWHVVRAGNRIQDTVAKSIRHLIVTEKMIRERGFLSIPGKQVQVRNRKHVTSSSLRKPDMIPPAEIRTAILLLIDAHHGATEEEIPVAVARMLGFDKTGSVLRKNIATQLTRLIQNEEITLDSDCMFKRVPKADC